MRDVMCLGNGIPRVEGNYSQRSGSEKCPGYVPFVITGPLTHSVGGQASNGRWCLSSSVVCRSL